MTPASKEALEARRAKLISNLKDAGRATGRRGHHKMIMFSARLEEFDHVVALISEATEREST